MKKSNHIPTYERSIDLVRKMDAFMHAGDIEAVTAFLDEHPAFLNLKYFYCGSYGLLGFAADTGRTDLCELLVARGADVNEHSADVDIPLDNAACEGHLETVKWLLAHGAWIEGHPGSISSPLMGAIIFGRTEVAKYLIAEGADLNRVHSRLHRTCLDLAVVWGQADIEKILRSKNAPSLLEKNDWSGEYGFPILRFIDSHVGRVLPIGLASIIPALNVGQRIALVNKDKNKMVFTVGLFALHEPMLELFIVLPGYWNMHDKSAENQFPSALLLILSEQVASGLHIEEGFLVLADDAAYKNLAWPENIAGFYVSDNDLSLPRTADDDIPEEDRVSLWTLVPMKRTKSGFSKQSLEKNRLAGWTKLTVRPSDPA
ncbi:ankyrin repeat domain-containing protein [Massilia sp. CCM 8734]|uniref:ankyrin repeat domain-containing protein n=1 Tax=Massilia sp. CCM 8734 TaxID=2609283 RepID=UPI0014208E3F|nr:ankyrin repeat domain-containing protein [Massilia sp. CCM 8734]NHZ97680.1 hypothetical protein [Massilia sp. CCM 8734]